MSTIPIKTLMSGILADLRKVKNVVSDLEAEALFAGDEKAAPAFDAFYRKLVEAQSAAAHWTDDLSPEPAQEAELRSAWTDALGVFSSIGPGWIPSEANQTPLKRLVSALEALPAELEPFEEIVTGGTLNTDELQDSISDALRAVDWTKVLSASGAPIAESVRRDSIVVTPHEDGSDGKGSIAIAYAPWAGAQGRADARRAWQMDVEQSVRRAHSDGAIGAPKGDETKDDPEPVEVFFGTNRIVETDNATPPHVAFTSGRDPHGLSYGIANLTVPKRRKRGEVSRPWRVPILGWQGSEDAKRHIVLVGQPTVISRLRFLEEIKNRDARGAAFLFVHGYNTPFRSGLWRTAQLAVDLDIDGLIFHYAWPSFGDGLHYDYDRESIEVSLDPFESFIKTLLEDARITSLNVVAHSKGSELVLAVFERLAAAGAAKELSARANNLVLASPDVDVDVATLRIGKVQSFFKSVTLYTNRFDRPLKLSAKKAGKPRAGGWMEDGHPLVVRPSDTIDASDADDDVFAFNHDAYVDAPILMYDMKSLFKWGYREPPLRTSSMQRQDTEDRGFYYRPATS